MNLKLKNLFVLSIALVLSACSNESSFERGFRSYCERAPEMQGADCSCTAKYLDKVLDEKERKILANPSGYAIADIGGGGMVERQKALEWQFIGLKTMVATQRCKANPDAHKVIDGIKPVDNKNQTNQIINDGVVVKGGADNSIELIPHKTGNVNLPSHCKSNEYPVLNAEIVKKADDGSIKVIGKYLSLCADQKNEPFDKLYYRYGKIGQIELELSGDAIRKLPVRRIAASPKEFESSIIFVNGSFDYVITECHASFQMCEYLTLKVYDKGRQISELQASKYESALANLDFDNQKSSVFTKRSDNDSR